MSASRLRIALNAEAGRIARYIWLAFSVFALGLALPGIPRYLELLQTPCAAVRCFGAQLSVAAAQAWVTDGENLLFYALAQFLLTLLIDALLLGTAAFLIRRKTANRATLVAAFVAVALATSTLSQALAFNDPRFQWPGQIILFVQMAGLLPLCCLFPDGHFQPRAMRWAALLYVLGSLVYLLPNYQGWLAPGTLGYALWLGFALLSLAAGGGTLLYRFRHAGSSARQEQMLWVLAGIGLATLVILIGGAPRLIELPFIPAHASLSEPFLQLLAGMFLAVGSLVCLLVALVNYEPVDTDVLVNRTIVYAGLTTFVIGAYVLIVGYLNAVFSSEHILFSFIASGVVAVVFHPLRDRLQRAVNRLMYGERDEPYRVLTRFGRQLEGMIEPSSALPLTVETVAHALKLPYVAITLKQDGGFQTVAAYGTVQAGLFRCPLVYATEPIGELLAAARTAGESLTQADEHLLRVLASQIGVAAHAVLLTTDLEQARLRIVAERAEARRQLGSDLHDGVGHQLVALTRQVERAIVTLAAQPSQSQACLTAINHQLIAVATQVRNLAHELFPPELEVLGLTGALRERIHTYPNLKILLDAPPALPPLPAAIEMAAYYIALESLTNVARHAHARVCRMRLRLSPAAATHQSPLLELDIIDDGQGFVPGAAHGLGLLSMRARAAELGGACRIEASPTGGTAVIVRIPCPQTTE